VREVNHGREHSDLPEPAHQQGAQPFCLALSASKSSSGPNGFNTYPTEKTGISKTFMPLGAIFWPRYNFIASWINSAAFRSTRVV